MIQGETYTVHIGSNLDILPTLPDNSVDSIVTDPPYGLSDNKFVAATIAKWISGERDFIPDGKGFMGKSWDAFVPPPALWDECLRVLKPGGHLLAFFGSRTQDIGALSIRLAGFEIRDSIAWMYGSGFPKSLDVSKAIDKAGGSPGFKVRNEITKLLISTKITDREIANHVGVARQLVGAWRNGLSLISEGQATRLKELLDCEIPRGAERAIVGKSSHHSDGRKKFTNEYVGGSPIEGTVDERLITAPSTPEAKQWEGWGTALKPALEPIVVARKPLIGTVAANVLEHGTGALNIDGSRIGAEEIKINTFDNGAKPFGDAIGEPYTTKQSQGRWPANVILDEYSAELLDEQSGVSVSKRADRGTGKKTNDIYGSYGDDIEPIRGHNDSGGASRFFYVAKASKRDRNEGLEELEGRRASAMGYDIGLGEAGEGMFKDRNPIKQNFHPTVKPTDLMRYLVKLVTPPGGTVLDPFTGSGSTGKAAILEGFRFIGCELTEDYIPIIEGRLAHAEKTKSEEPEGLF